MLRYTKKVITNTIPSFMRFIGIMTYKAKGQVREVIFGLANWHNESNVS